MKVYSDYKIARTKAKPDPRGMQQQQQQLVRLVTPFPPKSRHLGMQKQ